MMMTYCQLSNRTHFGWPWETMTDGYQSILAVLVKWNKIKKKEKKNTEKKGRNCRWLHATTRAGRTAETRKTITRD